jgi:hypothetical protein
MIDRTLDHFKFLRCHNCTLVYTFQTPHDRIISLSNTSRSCDRGRSSPLRISSVASSSSIILFQDKSKDCSSSSRLLMLTRSKRRHLRSSDGAIPTRSPRSSRVHIPLAVQPVHDKEDAGQGDDASR